MTGRSIKTIAVAFATAFCLTNNANVGETIPEFVEQQSKQEVSRGVSRQIITMEITAYCDGHITSTGTKPKRGIVAVDPDVIPYGSELYIEGVGTVIAEDCGGAIEGNMLDLYIPSRDEAIKWGRQHRKVHVIRRGYK